MTSPTPSNLQPPRISPRKTAAELLVSVRNVAEAEAIADAGVDVIDWKEPSDGALAPVSVEVWNEAAERFPERSLSAALGEQDTALHLAAKVPPAFRFAKAGPSGVATTSQLVKLWNGVALPSSVELVPVAYADHALADCPDVATILETAIQENRERLLVDTFIKNGRGLRDHLSDFDLSALLARARQAGVWIALAGSLRLDQVTALHDRSLSPDCWGVRGDVCCRVDDDRRVSPRQRVGEIDPVRVAHWAKGLKSVSQPVA